MSGQRRNLASMDSLYEQLFEQSVDGILLIDEGRILRANASVAHLHGYSPDELVGIAPTDLLHPDERPVAERRIARLLGGEALPDTHVYRSLHRDGHVLSVEVSTRLVRWDGRDILQAIVRDVTDTRAAAEMLHRSEARYRSLFDSVPIGLYRTTPEGRIVDINLALVEMLGYPDRETLLAAPVADGYADRADREAWRERIERAGSLVDSQALWRRYDGTTLWIEENARAVRGENGSVVFYEGSAKDISAQKRFEEALDREKAYFEQLFAGSPEAVVLCDDDGAVLRANEEFSRLLGYSEAECLGRGIDALVAPDADDLRAEAKRITSLVTAGKRITLESVRRRSDGTLVDVSVLAQPIFTGDRQVGVYAIYRDITARKRAEAALAATRRRVERLHDAAERLERAGSEDDVYRIVIEAADRILGFPHCAVDVARDGLLITQAVSANTPRARIRRIRIAQAGLAGEAFRARKTSIHNNVRPGELSEDASVPVRSLITVPLRGVGVFQAASYEADAFTDDDAKHLEILLGHTAEALARLGLQRELTDQAIRDSLTGLFNRRYFNDVIERETLRAVRYDHPLGLMMIDVDRFKEINDSLGHHAGDDVLRTIADVLCGCVRETDFVVRYGGDEFLVVLTETGEEAEQAAERIRTAVRRSRELRDIAGFPVSVSVGMIAWRPGSELTVELALARADEQMYEDKRRPIE